MRQNNAHLNTKLGNICDKKKEKNSQPRAIGHAQPKSIILAYEPSNTTDPSAHHRLCRVPVLTSSFLPGIPQPPFLFDQPAYSARYHRLYTGTRRLLRQLLPTHTPPLFPSQIRILYIDQRPGLSPHHQNTRPPYPSTLPPPLRLYSSFL